MKNLKNIEKINARFAATLKLLDEYVGSHKNIAKLVVFGPSVENDAYINSEEAEVYLAMYFTEEVVKHFTDSDFSQETCSLEREIPYVLTYAMQNDLALKKNSKLKDDVNKGVVIYDCKDALS